MRNRNFSGVLAIIILLFGISEGLKFGTPDTEHNPQPHFGQTYKPNTTPPPHTYKPPHNPHYGPTEPPHTYKPPISHYGPTEPPHTYKPPISHYGPTEPPHTYKPPISHYGPTEPPHTYKPPISHYGPTKPPHTYKPPISHYGPTEPPHTYKPPHDPHYGPTEPPHTYKPPHNPHYGPTEPPHTYKPPTHGPHPGVYSYATKPPKDDYDGCVDVSTYGKVKYHQVDKEHCEIVYKKIIHERWEEVCDNVTSLHCIVHPYTECKMEMENVTAYDCEWFWKHVDVKKCVNVTKTITHPKLKPNCTTIPKYHCTEKWKIEPTGEKVWAGTGDCKLIEWEDCELVKVNATIEWIEPDCNHTKPVPVHDIRPSIKQEMTSAMKCTVKKTTKCTPHTYKKCKYIHYTEAEIRPESKCVPYKIWVPHQERHHKQKCLFGKDKQSLPTGPLTGLQPGQSPSVDIKPVNGPSLKNHH